MGARPQTTPWYPPQAEYSNTKVCFAQSEGHVDTSRWDSEPLVVSREVLGKVRGGCCGHQLDERLFFLVMKRYMDDWSRPCVSLGIIVGVTPAVKRAFWILRRSTLQDRLEVRYPRTRRSAPSGRHCAFWGAFFQPCVPGCIFAGEQNSPLPTQMRKITASITKVKIAPPVKPLCSSLCSHQDFLMMCRASRVTHRNDVIPYSSLRVEPLSTPLGLQLL